MKSKTAMVNRIPITEARVNLGAVVKRVHLNGEYFILEKDGIPIAGIMGADELEDYLELQDPAVRNQIAKSNADIAAGRTRPASTLLAELKRMKAAKPKRSTKR
jgi:antitoxin (DNA-binding transcriptional repressor) of toxin-antitoxin stability system